MKTYRIITRKLSGIATLNAVLLLVAGMLFTGCDDFLTVDPKGSLSQNVLATRTGVNAVLVGAYAGLSPDNAGTNWNGAPDNWVYGSIMGGDAKKGSDAGDQNLINPLMRGFADPTNGYLNDHWRIKYEGIARTNEVLKILPLIPEEELSAAERANIEGQARFLRGHHYFELRRMYGMVPWVDETTTEFNVPNDVDIWPNIEADFKFAYENLPATQADRARANKWAAAAYLAKTYLYQEKWQEARDLFTTVINQGNTADGQPYGLVENYHDLFLPAAQYNQENVFMIEFTGDDGVTGGINNSRNGSMLNYPYNSPFRCCGFYQPSQDLVNSYQTFNGLPKVKSYNDTMVKNDMGIASDEPFTPDDRPLDPRLDWTVGRRGLPFLDWGPHPGQRWIRDQAYAGPYATKKHVYMKAYPGDVNNKSWAPGTSVNYHVIRFADVLLMAAEAEAQLGNVEQAREYVNMVRRRAANPTGFVSNADNEAFAVAVVDNEADMLNSGAILDEWVVRTDRNSTFVLVKGGEGAAQNIANWVEYPEPNYEVAEYSAADFGSGKQEALEKIYFERKLELATEGHRLFDLIRWGIAAETMNQYYSFEGKLTIDVNGGSWRFPGKYFPIPQRQIDLSVGKLQQNPGY